MISESTYVVCKLETYDNKYETKHFSCILNCNYWDKAINNFKDKSYKSLYIALLPLELNLHSPSLGTSNAIEITQINERMSKICLFQVSVVCGS
jgi:hypothetical protein